jgi:hypothetical protein
MFGDEDTALLGGSISSPRNIDRRRQAATARVSQFDIAALTNAKYHGGDEDYYLLTPAIIHGLLPSTLLTLSAVTTRSFWSMSPC